MIELIMWARNNEQPCPFCQATGSFVTLDEQENYIYMHDCDCLFNINIEFFGPDDHIDNDYDEQWGEQNEYYNRHNNQVFSKPPVNVEVAQAFIKTEKKPYAKYCHSCKANGVDNRLPQCTEDPPYKYRCKYCSNSLRSHPEYGEGKVYDMANFNKTWTFNANKQKNFIAQVQR